MDSSYDSDFENCSSLDSIEESYEFCEDLFFPHTFDQLIYSFKNSVSLNVANSEASSNILHMLPIVADSRHDFIGMVKQETGEALELVPK